MAWYYLLMPSRLVPLILYLMAAMVMAGRHWVVKEKKNMAVPVLLMLPVTGLLLWLTHLGLPALNLRFYVYLYDLSRNPGVEAPSPGKFVNIGDYSIYLQETDRRTGLGKGWRIYEHGDAGVNTSVLMAESGVFRLFPEQGKLKIKMFSGNVYYEMPERGGMRHDSREWGGRFYFDTLITVLDIPGMQAAGENVSMFAEHKWMLNSLQLTAAADSMRQRLAHFEHSRDSVYEGFGPPDPQGFREPPRAADPSEMNRIMMRRNYGKIMDDRVIREQEHLQGMRREFFSRLDASLCAMLLYVMLWVVATRLRQRRDLLPALLLMAAFFLSSILSWIASRVTQDHTRAWTAFVPSMVWIVAILTGVLLSFSRTSRVGKQDTGNQLP